VIAYLQRIGLRYTKLIKKNDSLDTSFEFTNPSGQERALRVFDENLIEVNMPLPDLFGPGTLTTIASRPDIGIMIIKHDKSPDSVRVETRIAKPMLKIGFALQAASCSVWLEGSPARLPVSFGNLCIASPSAVIQFEDAPSRDFDFLTLTMGPDFVLELIEEYGDRPSPEFERLVLEPRGEPSLIVSSFGAEARSIAERIRHCAFGGSVQRLYVEGATLELAAVSLQRLLRIVEHSGVVPDLLCIGKALTNGFPLSACIGLPDVMAAWPSSDGEAIHTSTFLGHPVGCAMALAQIEEIEKRDLPQRSARLGEFLLGLLQSGIKIGELMNHGVFLAATTTGVLYLASNFGDDWVANGYPVEEPR